MSLRTLLVLVFLVIPSGVVEKLVVPTRAAARRHIDVSRKFLSLVALLVLAACGVSYHVEPARLVVMEDELVSRETLLDALGRFLCKEGFEELGIDERMISLLKQTRDPDDQTIIDLQNRYTHLNRDRSLRVEMSEFTRPDMGGREIPYTAPTDPFFELRIYEMRPGGFSVEGRRFLLQLQVELEGTLTAPVKLAKPPPPSDQSAYWATTIINALTIAFWWMVAFAGAVAICGALARKLLRRASISHWSRRVIFVLASTWLAAPLPFPAASIAVIFLPNLFAFPWANLEHFHRVQNVAALSFPTAFLLCTLIVVRLFPAPRKPASGDRHG